MKIELDVQEINAVMALLASLMDKIRMQAQAQMPAPPTQE
jgi:outer membrane murein-binding lipoprotein Lpp